MAVYRLVASIILAVGMVTTAQAAEVCAPRDFMLKVLDEKYHQVPVAMGLDAGGAMLEIVASVDGAWTLLSTKPDGVSCLNGTGTHWELVEVITGVLH